jgi:hypothetical protein
MGWSCQELVLSGDETWAGPRGTGGHRGRPRERERQSNGEGAASCTWGVQAGVSLGRTHFVSGESKTNSVFR